VAVTDAGGLVTTANIELYLSNANVAPVVPGGVCSVPENSPENTVSRELSPVLFSGYSGVGMSADCLYSSQTAQFLIAVSIGDVNPLDNIVSSLYGALTDDSNTPIVKLVPTGNPRVWNLVTATGLIDFEGNNQRFVGVRVSEGPNPTKCHVSPSHIFILHTN
jgi:hypothetical protein